MSATMSGLDAQIRAYLDQDFADPIEWSRHAVDHADALRAVLAVLAAVEPYEGAHPDDVRSAIARELGLPQ